MSKKKAAGAKARQGGNVAGKRLGVKISGGSQVKPGQIIVRQRGRTFIPGENVGMGRDYTIFSKAEGTVAFNPHTNNRKRIDVVVE